MKKLIIAAAITAISYPVYANCQGVDMKKLHGDLETVIGDGEIGNEIVLYNKMMSAQQKSCVDSLKAKKGHTPEEAKIVELYDMIGHGGLGGVKMPSHF